MPSPHAPTEVCYSLLSSDQLLLCSCTQSRLTCCSAFSSSCKLGHNCDVWKAVSSGTGPWNKTPADVLFPSVCVRACVLFLHAYMFRELIKMASSSMSLSGGDAIIYPKLPVSKSKPLFLSLRNITPFFLFGSKSLLTFNTMSNFDCTLKAIAACYCDYNTVHSTDYTHSRESGINQLFCITKAF